MGKLGFTSLDRGDASTVLLGIIGTGISVPGTALAFTNDAAHISENIQDVDVFERLDISGDAEFGIALDEFYATDWKNPILLTPYTIFDGTFKTDPNQLEPLPYVYELKFDHITTTNIPHKTVRLFTDEGLEVPRQYYKTFIKISYRIEDEAAAAAAGPGNAFGPFVIQASQVDLAKARAALGENIWGEIYGASDNEEHLFWERMNKELLRPPWNLVNDIPNAPSGTLSRVDDGRYSRSEFLDFFLDIDGFWGQEVSGTPPTLLYTDNLGEEHTLGDALTGEMDTTAKTIGQLQSEKYLDGDELYPADVAYQVTLLLPEFLVHQDGQTFWVQYNKYVRYVLSGVVQEEFKPNHVEVVNPTLLMKQDLDYSINFSSNTVLVDPDFEERFGSFDYMYTKKNKAHFISLLRPTGTSRDGWFLEITKGDFRVGTTIYQTHRLVDSQGHARDWFQGSILPVVTENGLNVHKIVKERARVVDRRSIAVSHTPIYFWNGPRDSGAGRDTSYGYFANETDSAVFDTGEYADPENPWPRYIPPSLIDWHTSPGVCFYPVDPTSDPEFSHGITIYRNGERIDNADIDTWDLWNGIIFFKEPIHPDDRFDVTYLTEENRVTLPMLNVNPIVSEMLYTPGIFQTST